ncbi:MAG: hypothetical protein FWG88_05135 [Oscillospiraceae bacterium]|nr:hypothetical protein [Oscillospiraceae bacterium]
MKYTMDTVNVLRKHYQKYINRLAVIEANNPDITRLKELGDIDHLEWQLCLEAISVITIIALDSKIGMEMITETDPLSSGLWAAS